MNKTYIIAAIVVLVATAGGYFWFGGSSAPDPSVLEKGVKNLSRDAAAAKIKEYLRINPQMTGGYIQNTGTQHYSLSYVMEDNKDVQSLRRLVTAGYVKIVSEKSGYGGYLEFQYDFTDKATPYMHEVSPGSTYKQVVGAEVVDVEVTGITEPTQGTQGNMRTANYTAKYEQTAIGKVIDEEWAAQEIKSQLPFVLYDDGWRIIGY